MKFRFLIVIASALAASAGSASAQSPAAAPATHELAPVTVTASRHGALYRIAHIDEQRQYVLGLMEENHRLAAELDRADSKVALLEVRLVEVQADHDRRVAGIAAIDSAAAVTRRMRLELEDRLRRLETVASREQNDGSR